MGKIIYSKKLEFELNELVDILYYKQYFGFIEDAKLYVQHIRDFIVVTIKGVFNAFKTKASFINLASMPTDRNYLQFIVGFQVCDASPNTCEH